MPAVIGPTIDDGLYNVWTGEVYFENVVTDPANADTGESVSSHSSYYLGLISIETEAAAPPKVGAVVVPYDLNFIMQIFGELG